MNRKIKHIPKAQPPTAKPQQSVDYKIQRHKAGLEKALAQKHPESTPQVLIVIVVPA